MALTAWYVTLRKDTAGPRRRTVAGVSFNANDDEARTRRMLLTEEVKSELAATGDYTFRPAAGATGEPLTRKSHRQGRKSEAATPEPAAPDPGPASPTAEEA